MLKLKSCIYLLLLFFFCATTVFGEFEVLSRFEKNEGVWDLQGDKELIDKFGFIFTSQMEPKNSAKALNIAAKRGKGSWTLALVKSSEDDTFEEKDGRVYISIVVDENKKEVPFSLVAVDRHGRNKIIPLKLVYTEIKKYNVFLKNKMHLSIGPSVSQLRATSTSLDLSATSDGYLAPTIGIGYQFFFFEKNKILRNLSFDPSLFFLKRKSGDNNVINSYSYFNIPLTIRYSFFKFFSGGVAPTFNYSPFTKMTAYYLDSSKEVIDDEGTSFTLKETGIKKLDYGLTFLLKGEYPMFFSGKMPVFIEFKYYLGLSNISYDSDISRKWKDIQLTAGVSYPLFGMSEEEKK